jgi:hypothetical protein
MDGNTKSQPVDSGYLVAQSQGSDPTAQPEPDYSNALSPAGGFPQSASQKFHDPNALPDDIVIPEPQLAPITPDPTPPPVPDPTPTPAPQPIPDNHIEDDEELSAIKIQALDELYPLIDKLDLSPEERFKIIMMMIQASDNEDLVELAYEAAHKIQDEKTKAQALLDIINEINYFTHQDKT